MLSRNMALTLRVHHAGYDCHDSGENFSSLLEMFIYGTTLALRDLRRMCSETCSFIVKFWSEPKGWVLRVASASVRNSGAATCYDGRLQA